MYLALDKNGNLGHQTGNQRPKNADNLNVGRAKVMQAPRVENTRGYILSSEQIRADAQKRAQKVQLERAMGRQKAMAKQAQAQKAQALYAQKSREAMAMQAQKPRDRNNEILKQYFTMQGKLSESQLVNRSLGATGNKSMGTLPMDFDQLENVQPGGYAMNQPGSNPYQHGSVQDMYQKGWSRADFQAHELIGSPITRSGEYGPSTDYDRFIAKRELDNAMPHGAPNCLSPENWFNIYNKGTFAPADPNDMMVGGSYSLDPADEFASAVAAASPQPSVDEMVGGVYTIDPSDEFVGGAVNADPNDQYLNGDNGDSSMIVGGTMLGRFNDRAIPLSRKMLTGRRPVRGMRGFGMGDDEDDSGAVDEDVFGPVDSTVMVPAAPADDPNCDVFGCVPAQPPADDPNCDVFGCAPSTSSGTPVVTPPSSPSFWSSFLTGIGVTTQSAATTAANKAVSNALSTGSSGTTLVKNISPLQVSQMASPNPITSLAASVGVPSWTIYAGLAAIAAGGIYALTMHKKSV